MWKWIQLHSSEWKTVFLFLLIVALLKNVFQDVYILETIPLDLRSRVIGSRMIMDGRSPYFYLWNSKETLAYYDPVGPFALEVSRVTATPFFNNLFGPVARLPQYQINILWFFLQYFFLALPLLMLAVSTPSDAQKQRWAIMAAITVVFTYTYGWHLNICAGQTYILIPAFAACCYYCLARKSKWLYQILFAFFACALILLRPTAILFFTPFLFYGMAYKKWILSAAALFLLYAIFVIYSPVQKHNWVDYFESLKVHVQYHGGKLPLLTKPPYATDVVKTLEGTEIFYGNYYWSAKHFPEYRNFYILVAEVFVKKVTIPQMTIIGIVSCLLLLLPLGLIRKYKIAISPDKLILLGFIVYNTYEFFTPVPRYDYQWVQFIFPLLLAVVCSKRLYLIPTILFAAGILLNTATWDFINVERRIGEGMIVMALIFLVYRDLIMRYVNERKFITSNNLYLL